MITVNTEKEFEGTYKGMDIFVSSDHGLGEPEYDHLTRFNITVTDKAGMYAVDSYKDCHTIQDAIRYALKGAQLI